jgi:hypothetical protein
MLGGKAMNSFKTNLHKLFAELKTLEIKIENNLKGLRYENKRTLRLSVLAREYFTQSRRDAKNNLKGIAV